MEGQSSLLLLPPRPKKNQGIPPGARSISLRSNLYPIEFAFKPQIHLYNINSHPPINPQDADYLLRRLLAAKKREVRSQVGKFTSMGQTIYGTQEITSYTFTVPKDEENHISSDYELTITHIKALYPDYEDISKWSTQQQTQILQISKIALREKLNKMKMAVTSRNRFFEQVDPRNIGLKEYIAIKCYDLRLAPIGRQLKLIIDVGFRVTGNLNVLEEFMVLKNRGIGTGDWQGKRVLTLYNNRTYKILKVVLDKNINQKCISKGQNQMSIKEYMKEYYKITDLDQKQPLLEVISRQYTVDKKTKQKRIQTCLLVPQLCRFVKNLKEIQSQCKDNRGTYNNLNKRIKITADQRKKQEERLIDHLNKDEQGKKEDKKVCRIDNTCDDIKGICFDSVDVQFNRTVKVVNGIFDQNKQQKLQEKASLDKDQWLMIYSKGDKFQDNDDAYDLVDKLMKSAKAYDISFGDPVLASVENSKFLDPALWIDKLKYQIENNEKNQNKKKIKIVLIIFNTNRESKLYGPIKKYLTMAKIPSQVFFSHKAKSISVCGKLMVQMAAKLGFVTWSVPTNNSFWKKKIMAIGAISVVKNTKISAKGKLSKEEKKEIDSLNKHEFLVSLVGTTNGNMSRIYSKVLVAKEADLENPKFYEDIFIDWIKAATVNNGRLPDVIVLYREGMTELQLNRRGKAEIEGMKEALLRGKKREPNYNPTFVCLHVVRNSNKRVYQINVRNEANAGKFWPEVSNPPSGTIVFDPLSNNNVYDFHIAPQLTRNTKDMQEGTTTLTQCQVVYLQSAEEIPQEALAQLTLEQCYNTYPIWMGAVKVPGVLQSSIRLAKMFGDHFHEGLPKDEKGGRQIQDKPFYL